MRRVVLVLAVAVVAAGIGLGYLLWAGSSRGPPPFPVPGEGERVTVEVLNGTDVNGLARLTAQRLRAGGIDVVFFGTAAADTFSMTQIIVRRGDTTAAVRVRELLEIGTVIVAENPRLLLDISVYLGRDAAGALVVDP